MQSVILVFSDHTHLLFRTLGPLDRMTIRICSEYHFVITFNFSNISRSTVPQLDEIRNWLCSILPLYVVTSLVYICDREPKNSSRKKQTFNSTRNVYTQRGLVSGQWPTSIIGCTTPSGHAGDDT